MCTSGRLGTDLTRSVGDGDSMVLAAAGGAGAGERFYRYVSVPRYSIYTRRIFA